LDKKKKSQKTISPKPRAAIEAEGLLSFGKHIFLCNADQESGWSPDQGKARERPESHTKPAEKPLGNEATPKPNGGGKKKRNRLGADHEGLQ